MLELYDFANSICAQKVRLTLFEKGLDCQKHDVNLFVSAQYDPAYLKLNPKGYVPTLVHDGKAIRESNLICEYLNDVFQGPVLVPRCTATCLWCMDTTAHAAPGGARAQGLEKRQ